MVSQHSAGSTASRPACASFKHTRSVRNPSGKPCLVHIRGLVFLGPDLPSVSKYKTVLAGAGSSGIRRHEGVASTCLLSQSAELCLHSSKGKKDGRCEHLVFLQTRNSLLISEALGIVGLTPLSSEKQKCGPGW